VHTYLARMEPKAPHDPERDELLANYEGGVWTFIAVVGCALLGIIFWVGFVVL
jgi:type IV secretory pathway VirB2 component (pilin)